MAQAFPLECFFFGRKLLWHALGAKTVELINQNVHVESVRDDLETLVLDAQVLEGILKDTDPKKRA